MANVTEITDATFDEEVLQSDLPVLVDLWAVWCGPCRMVGPIVEGLAAEFDGQLKVGKLNVDTSPTTPVQYGVQGIPTCILFKDGQEVGRIIGARPKGKFLELIEPHLA